MDKDKIDIELPKIDYIEPPKMLLPDALLEMMKNITSFELRNFRTLPLGDAERLKHTKIIYDYFMNFEENYGDRRTDLDREILEVEEK